MILAFIIFLAGKSHLSLRSQVRQKRSGYMCPPRNRPLRETEWTHIHTLVLPVIGRSEKRNGHIYIYNIRLFLPVIGCSESGMELSVAGPEEFKPRNGITTLGSCQWAFASSPVSFDQGSLWFLKRQRIDIDGWWWSNLAPPFKRYPIVRDWGHQTSCKRNDIDGWRWSNLAPPCKRYPIVRDWGRQTSCMTKMMAME